MNYKIVLSSLAATLLLIGCGDNESAGGDEAPVAASDGEYVNQVVKTPEGGYLMGNPNAPVRLTEYGSLACVHCRDFEVEAFGEIKSMVDAGKISFEFRNFLLGAIDTPATILSRCAGPEHYFALTEAWYGNWDAQMDALTSAVQDAGFRQSLQGLTPEQATAKVAEQGGVTEFFTARGISKDQAEACLADEANYAEIESLRNRGVQDGVEGTPTFLINGEKVEFAGWPALKADLAKAGAD